MGEKAGTVGISVFGEVLDEPLIGDDAGMGKAVNAFATFYE
jgi:hypothetical protein